MKRYLVNELKLYLTLMTDVSKEEISELKEWVTAGNSPYSNVTAQPPPLYQSTVKREIIG